jgi:signal transduction histidine kinase
MGNFMLGIFILLLYQEMSNMRGKRAVYLFGLAMIFAVYMFFMHTYVQQPVRSISGVLILGRLTCDWKRSVNWTALVLALLVGYSAWIISVFVTAFLGAVFDIFQNEAYWVLLLLVQTGVYLTCYKIIRLKNGTSLIDEFEIKGIIFAASGIVLTFFGGYHMTRNQLHEYNLPLFRAAFTSLIIVVLTAVFLIVIFSKRYRERVKAEKLRHTLENEKQTLEKENRTLGEEKQALEEHNSELARHRLALQRDNSELSTKHHKVRELAKSTSELHIVLIDEVQTATSQDSIEKLPAVRRYLEIAKQVGAELSEELTLDDFVNEFRGFVLPHDWLSLKHLVVKAIIACEQKEFSAFAKNTATTWEQIKFPKIKLNRLVSNLVRNAMCELSQTDTDDKAMEIHFFDDDNNSFTVEVYDTAREFHVQVLKNLGQRGNSTNGSGNGYAEIFELLSETGASLSITEQREDAYATKKSIRISFDDKERFLIRTGYRYATLKETLADSLFEIEPLP